MGIFTCMEDYTDHQSLAKKRRELFTEFQSKMMDLKTEYYQAVKELDSEKDHAINSAFYCDRWATVGRQTIEDKIPDLKTLRDQITFILKYKGKALKRTELEEEIAILNNGNHLRTRNAIRKMQDKHYIYAISINGSKKNQYWALPDWFVDTENGMRLASEYFPSHDFNWTENIKIKVKSKMTEASAA
jgi:hypothetical protein